MRLTAESPNRGRIVRIMGRLSQRKGYQTRSKRHAGEDAGENSESQRDRQRTPRELRVIVERMIVAPSASTPSDSADARFDDDGGGGSEGTASSQTPSSSSLLRRRRRRFIALSSQFLRVARTSERTPRSQEGQQATPRHARGPPRPRRLTSNLLSLQGAPQLVIRLEPLDPELLRRAVRVPIPEETPDPAPPHTPLPPLPPPSPTPPPPPPSPSPPLHARPSPPPPPTPPPPQPPPPPPRRRHAAVPHRVTYRDGYDTPAETSEDLCRTPYTCGALTDQCAYCGARFFTKEKKDRRGVRLICCKRGAVQLPELQCPVEFRRLFTAAEPTTTTFLENVRAVNSLFAMASFKTSTPTRRVEGQGHWSFTVCGQIYHFTVGVPSSQELRTPRLAHYYFLDVDDVMNRRTQFLEDRVNRETLRLIETTLRRVNRYVRAFRSMGEVLEEEKARRGGVRPVQDVVIGFVRAGDMQDRLRRHALPESRNEIAAVFYGTEPPFDVDLALYPRAAQEAPSDEDGGDEAAPAERRHELKNLHPLADPLVYPMLFPYGEDGWTCNLRHGGRKISMREFYRFRIQIRDRFSLLHNAGKLFQQYLVDCWIRVEGDMLWWYRQNQNKFRFARRLLLRRVLTENPANRTRIGRPVVLPSAFVGGARHMQRQYLDAMAVVARHGKPDLFVTFTCNPAWPEVTENLEYRQKPEHRPDLVCRVFQAKFLEFLDDMVHKQIFGVVLNYHYVVEFQKRGLPHAHVVITFHPTDTIHTPDQVDALISATIPDPETQPLLYALVGRHQVHRPCGPQNPTAKCMVDGRCKKFFPKQHTDRTVLGAGGDRRPVYRRPDDGRRLLLDDSVITNTRIVPYNPYALAKFQCHINFEAVGSIGSMKYLYKYVSKGVDCTTIVEDRGEGGELAVDEIANYLECRYVSSMEASWRLLEFKMHDRSHSVIVLPVHLPDEDNVHFRVDDDVGQELGRVDQVRSKLEDWFRLNAECPEARQFRYVEIPEHYVWATTPGQVGWARRRQISKVIGTLVHVTPRDGDLELFYLRILLKYVTGATSYEDVRTYRGVVYETFEEACGGRDLLARADEYDRCLEEAVLMRQPHYIRRLFALIVCILDEDQLRQVATLWQRHRNSMVEDHLNAGLSRRQAFVRCIEYVSSIVRQNKPEYNCDTLGITLPDDLDDNDDDDDNNNDNDDRDHDVFAAPDALDAPMANLRIYDAASLNDAQKRIFVHVAATIAHAHDIILTRHILDTMGIDERFVRSVIDSVGGAERGLRRNVFFVDGPGGSGKTYLYNCLIQFVSSVLRLPVRAMAWTGIAANLLIGGTTAHRCFRLPINLSAESTVGWHVDSRQARALGEVALFVWDEAPMTHRYAVDMIDRFLQNVTGNTVSTFGGKCFVFGGDFRQVLPVVPRGHRATILDASLKASVVWRNMFTHRLRVNMRTGAERRAESSSSSQQEKEEEEIRRGLGNAPFDEWLLTLGEGNIPYVTVPRAVGAPDDLVEIPKLFRSSSLDELLQFTYADDYASDDVGDRAILCPTNAMVRHINDAILDALPGERESFISVDSCRDEPEDRLQIPADVLNAVEVSGLPPHELRLKRGAIVMLLRNLDVDRGECNGTRLRIVSLGRHLLECEFVNGERKGERFLLPKIKMIARDSMVPHDIIRIQFPIRLAYAMTINKAQGQTFRKVGIYLKTPCFAHGQLYVAFSRVRSARDVRVFVEESSVQGTFRGQTGRTFTRNVVYHSVLGERLSESDTVPDHRPRQRRHVVDDRDLEGGRGNLPVPTTTQVHLPADIATATHPAHPTATTSRNDAGDTLRISNSRPAETAERGRHAGPGGYVDKRGVDRPLDLVPFRTRTELLARLSTYDRPGTSGAALLPPFRRLATLDDEDE